jgi:hypothetical protein
VLGGAHQPTNSYAPPQPLYTTTTTLEPTANTNQRTRADVPHTHHTHTRPTHTARQPRGQQEQQRPSMRPRAAPHTQAAEQQPRVSQQSEQSERAREREREKREQQREAGSASSRAHKQSRGSRERERERRELSPRPPPHRATLITACPPHRATHCRTARLLSHPAPTHAHTPDSTHPYCPTTSYYRTTAVCVKLLLYTPHAQPPRAVLP